jgi:hypothetical protein
VKYAKTLTLIATAATALMAFAATASATTVTSPTGTTYTSTIRAESAALSFDGAFVTITCNKSTFEGKIEKHGSGVTAAGNLSTLDFQECNFPFKTESPGSLEFHAIRKGITPHETCVAATETDNCSATVTSNGTKLTFETSVGSCTFTTGSTAIGTLTTTATTGGKGKLDIAGTIPRTGGSFLCGSSATWTGSYIFSTPSTLWIDD